MPRSTVRRRWHGAAWRWREATSTPPRRTWAKPCGASIGPSGRSGPQWPRLELAEALAADGIHADAIVEARTALAVFTRLGARPAADRTAALLRGLGDAARVRPADAAVAVGSLTRREAEVLALIREGLTNPEIGERLFISAKTAEHHVGRVLAKLGVRSRSEAAALAASAMADAESTGIGIGGSA